MYTKALSYILAISVFFAASAFPRPARAEVSVAGHLYLVPDFESIAFADATLNLIQCAFTKENWLVDISEEAEAGFPTLRLKEVSGNATASLAFNPRQSITLGSYAPGVFGKDLCEALLRALSQPPEQQAGSAIAGENASFLKQLPNESGGGNAGSSAMLANTSYSPPERKNFFANNWPYLAVAGIALAAGFVLLRPHGENASTTEKISRGFVTR